HLPAHRHRTPPRVSGADRPFPRPVHHRSRHRPARHRVPHPAAAVPHRPGRRHNPHPAPNHPWHPGHPPRHPGPVIHSARRPPRRRGPSPRRRRTRRQRPHRHRHRRRTGRTPRPPTGRTRPAVLHLRHLHPRPP